MEKLTIEEIVKNLVGPVNPIGQSSVDEERFENLKVLCELTDSLVKIIDDVSYLNKYSHEYSVKKASDYAGNFLKNTIGIES